MFKEHLVGWHLEGHELFGSVQSFISTPYASD